MPVAMDSMRLRVESGSGQFGVIQAGVGEGEEVFHDTQEPLPFAVDVTEDFGRLIGGGRARFTGGGGLLRL